MVMLSGLQLVLFSMLFRLELFKSIVAPAMDTVDGRWRICILLGFLGITFLAFVRKNSHNRLGFLSPRSKGFTADLVEQFSSKFDPRITGSSSFTETEGETKEIGGKCDLFDGK